MSPQKTAAFVIQLNELPKVVKTTDALMQILT
jgi:hypothetical protein